MFFFSPIFLFLRIFYRMLNGNYFNLSCTVSHEIIKGVFTSDHFVLEGETLIIWELDPLVFLIWGINKSEFCLKDGKIF